MTVEELYDFLSLNTPLPAVEAQLALFIQAAREAFVTLTAGRVICPTVFRQHMWCFPPDGQPIRLMRGECLEVSEITYYDANDQPQTLTGWTADTSDLVALVVKDQWPEVSDTVPRPVRVEFVAGWSDTDTIPASVRQAVLMLAAHYYSVREAYSDSTLAPVPMGFEAQCSLFRTGLGGI